MAVPAGVQTCVVTFGPAGTLGTGEPLSMEVKVTPSRSAVWAATGAPLIGAPEIGAADAGETGTLTLINPDQPGFIDQAGNTVRGWTFTAAVTYRRGGTRVRGPVYVTFTLLEGDTNVDLDTLIPVSTDTGAKVAIPDMWTGGIAEAVTAAQDAQEAAEAAALSAGASLPLTARGTANGVASLGAGGTIPIGQIPTGIPRSADVIAPAEKGAASGVATLGTDTKVPDAQLPTRLSDAALTATFVQPAQVTAALAPVSAQAASAKSMAVRGFDRKIRPVSSMWAFPGATGHGFTSAGSAGAVFNLDDISDFALGDRSVKMTPPATNSTYVRIAKTGLTIDATGKYVRVWIKIADITKLNDSVSLMLGDNSFANYFIADIVKLGPMGSNPERKSIIKSGVWTPIDIPWSAFTVGAGSPSRSAITAAAVLSYGAASGATSIWWNGVAGLAEPSAYPNGVISLTFDDTYVDAFTVARPYLDRFGYAATLYPIQDNFGQAGRLTEVQATELFRVNGWDFGYHASTQAAHDTGYDTMTEAQLVAEFEKQRAWAASRGIAGDSFAWPLAYFNELSQKVAARYFRTGRTNGANAVEALPPSDPMRLRPIIANGGNSLATLQAQVDRVKSGKGWGVITFHRIVPSAPGANDTTTAIFQGLIDYIAAQGVAVETVGQVMSRV